MITFRFRTDEFRPPRRVTVRLATTRPAAEFLGYYRDGCWVFDVPDGTGEVWLALDGLAQSPALALTAGRDFTEADAGFAEPAIAIDDGRLQRRWFPNGPDRDVWDIIVVGTGMGGGLLQSRLASEHSELNVLGIEAGSLLFPSHTGNLPRRVFPPGDQATSLWNLYSELGSRPFDVVSDDPAGWGGWQVFALGGKSLFWGALTPRMGDHDFDLGWPTGIRDDLNTTWYDEAERIMGVDSPKESDYESEVVQLLDDVLPGRRNRPARAAITTQKRTSWRIPGGLFSTAELLLEQRLRNPNTDQNPPQNGKPFIHLAELVTHIEPGEGAGWVVHSIDLRDGSPQRHRTWSLVLSAGSIETARLALSSDLGNPLIGQGLTEHPMWYVHFQIPLTNRYARRASSVKLLSEQLSANGDDWNMQLELGSDLNEGQPLSATSDQPVMSVLPGYLACQIVFLCRSELSDGTVTIDPATSWPDTNADLARSLHPATLTIRTLDPDPEPLQAIANQLFARLDAEPVSGGSLNLKRSGVGFVAHEVGTMRIGASAATGVVDANLEVFGHPNLFVCDNSVFPSCPAANPSLTLGALALRLADHLAALT